ncbi:hypothetical protein SLH46_04435 [Draconibacterium sp. IB214405]|uniref:hypothetical protein n=1 Tax=Draconibacterium sp. IB214405 TaxID=3097352 RepID=UPI002A172834|nr:hypothetical protein [Draconibacterium sp. IB214405]MDX8338420.1 hypothetical protein [Draconibacterium sp. IB214405]
MKTITIDISEKVYTLFRGLLKQLPKGSYKIYEEDPDVLTAEEQKELYSIQNKLDKGDLSDFVDWDDVQDKF